MSRPTIHYLAGYTAAMVADDDREFAYYRAVEDLFSTLRGVPHILSPKDFQLLREWWRDDVPLFAVRAGITEVFARRRERGEAAPIVSLGYCRHAVRAHAARAAEMHVGAPDDGDMSPLFDARPGLEALANDLSGIATRLRPERPRIAEVIDRFSGTVAVAAELPASVLEEHLFALESALLANCLEALDDARRGSIEARARKEAESTTATPEAFDRAFRALRDRLLRDELELPRLELSQ